MNNLSAQFRLFKRCCRILAARREIQTRDIQARAHGLEQPVVVSLTSYPARFDNLGWTLASLLNQTAKPDAVILWVGREDFQKVPDTLFAFESRGLSIRPCDDMRAYNKILPALQAFPDANIITVDDDVYYPANAVEQLVRARATSGDPVICHRAHQIRFESNGQPRAYTEWSTNIRSPRKGADVFPTGCSGVLYSPGSLPSETTNTDLITRLCPQADDVWLYWMHCLNGHTSCKIGGRVRVLEWHEPDEMGLRLDNIGAGRNDWQIQAMIQEFGWPAGQ